MNTKSIADSRCALHELIAEIDDQRRQSKNANLDSNFRTGLRKCEELEAALDALDIGEIRQRHSALARVIDDVLPWEGNILTLAEELEAAIFAIDE